MCYRRVQLMNFKPPAQAFEWVIYQLCSILGDVDPRQPKPTNYIVHDKMYYLFVSDFHQWLGLYPFGEILNYHDYKSGTSSCQWQWSQNVYAPLVEWQTTPVDTEKMLGPEGSPVTDPTLYRSLAGALQYLTFTQPDLSYAVQQLCLYMHDPRKPYLNAMKRVLRYLRGTTDLGLQLFRSTTSQLIAYSDANWVGYPATHRSTSRYCVFLSDNLLTWSSKRQDTLSRYSAEAEYQGVANAVAKTSWIRNILHELYTPLFTATLVYCDNVSAVYMSANPVQHQCTKHIEINIHFVHYKVAVGHVRVLHVPSLFQKTQRSRGAVPAVPDISGGRQAYKGAAQ
ncbi:ribonuclease H-like domain-containing protein [Tanacetum coccineum]